MNFDTREDIEGSFQESIFSVWKFHIKFYLLIAFLVGTISIGLALSNYWDMFWLIVQIETLIFVVIIGITLIFGLIILFSKIRLHFDVSPKYSLFGFFIFKMKFLYIPGILLIIISFYNIYSSESISNLFNILILITGVLYILFIKFISYSIKQSDQYNKMKDKMDDI